MLLNHSCQNSITVNFVHLTVQISCKMLSSCYYYYMYIILMYKLVETAELEREGGLGILIFPPSPIFLQKFSYWCLGWKLTVTRKWKCSKVNFIISHLFDLFYELSTISKLWKSLVLFTIYHGLGTRSTCKLCF